MSIALTTSMASFETLHGIVDKMARGKVVRVDKTMVLNLLMDHSAMIARLNELGEHPSHGAKGEG